MTTVPMNAYTQNADLIRAVKKGLLNGGYCLDKFHLAQLEDQSQFYLSVKIESEMFFSYVLPLVRKRAAVLVAPERRLKFFRHTCLVAQLSKKVILGSEIELWSPTCKENSFQLKMPWKFEIDSIRSTLAEIYPLEDYELGILPQEMLHVEDAWAKVLNMFIDDFTRSVRHQLEQASSL
ncbi:hypothetical protein ACTXK7_06905 [Vreelandella alkaliphila]|uniref:hypothetical protein n=1 Tax=Halomonadaceae TaxID=28256 RepID=UPI003CF1363F